MTAPRRLQSFGAAVQAVRLGSSAVVSTVRVAAEAERLPPTNTNEMASRPANASEA